jgi:hypothetical protein
MAERVQSHADVSMATRLSKNTDNAALDVKIVCLFTVAD